MQDALKQMIKPSIAKVFLPVFIVLISVVLPLRVVATTKVTYDLFQGIPLSFLALSSGPCYSKGPFCGKLQFDSINIGVLILDLLILYVLICLVQFIIMKKRAV